MFSCSHWETLLVCMVWPHLPSFFYSLHLSSAQTFYARSCDESLAVSAASGLSLFCFLFLSPIHISLPLAVCPSASFPSVELVDDFLLPMVGNSQILCLCVSFFFFSKLSSIVTTNAIRFHRLFSSSICVWTSNSMDENRAVHVFTLGHPQKPKTIIQPNDQITSRMA